MVRLAALLPSRVGVRPLGRHGVGEEIQASSSFLGFGIPPPFSGWGRMPGVASLHAPGALAGHLAGGVLSLAVFGWNVFGDALRDLLDPRLIGAGARYS